MLTKSDLRDRQIDLLNKNIEAFAHILEAAPADSLRTYRDGGEGWTVTEVICHLRDYDAIFLERAKLTATQDTPLLPNPNPDELATELAYDQEFPNAALEAWRANRKKYLDFLKSVENDADWEREGNHPRRGLLTLADQLTLTTWHDANHLEQMTRIMKEQKL